MASTKFYLDLRSRAKDGKGTVLIQIFHNHSMTSISTGIRISPNEWDGKKVIRISGAEVINANLREQLVEIDKRIALLSMEEEFSYLTAADIKRRITNTTNRLSGRFVGELFREYMDSGNLKEGTKEIYRTTLRKVISFGGESLRIEAINYKWLRGFEQFLSKGQGINGRAIYLRSLRAVCNYALHTGVKFQYPFDNFHIKQEATKKRSVSIELFRKFLGYPTSKANSRYRDYFLLMFYLIGINSKDLLLARKDSVSDGRLEYTRAKTHKKYSVKIEPEAEELLKQYEGSNWLLEAMDHCQHYKSFAHEMNDALKEIGEEIEISDELFGETKKVIDPVIPGITTYFARHCWATFAYEIGIPIDTISQALGHSFGNKTTLIYVKFDQQKVDDANRQVIDYLWNASV